MITQRTGYLPAFISYAGVTGRLELSQQKAFGCMAGLIHFIWGLKGNVSKQLVDLKWFQEKLLRVDKSFLFSSYPTQCLVLTFCTEFIAIVVKSWYCSERPGNKGRTTPCVVVLIHKLGLIAPRKLWMLWDHFLKSLSMKLVTTFSSPAKALLTWKFQGREGRWRSGADARSSLLAPKWSLALLRMWNQIPFHVKYCIHASVWKH